jgi:hypothetical protein
MDFDDDFKQSAESAKRITLFCAFVFFIPKEILFLSISDAFHLAADLIYI